MIVARLAVTNTKRVLRNKGLRAVLVVLPVLIALLRVIFVHNKLVLQAAQLCPIVCVLLLSAVLYGQWWIDSARGLIAGFRSSPISPRAVAASRLLSGALILLAQMTAFLAILAIRF